MTTPTIPTNPPTATWGAKAAAAFGEVVAEEAASDTVELASSLMLDARDGPDALEGLAIVDPVEEGP